MATVTIANKALETCDGVINIAKNEQLVQGQYLTDVRNPKLAESGAICGGHQACLVGSLYIANGIPISEMLGWGFSFSWYTRESFMKNKPALRLAYAAINEASLRRMVKVNETRLNNLARRHGFDRYGIGPVQGWGEFFFETFLALKPRKVVMAEVIQVTRNAKRLIKTKAVTL